jgi:hypothetical protein
LDEVRTIKISSPGSKQEIKPDFTVLNQKPNSSPLNGKAPSSLRQVRPNIKRALFITNLFLQAKELNSITNGRFYI